MTWAFPFRIMIGLEYHVRSSYHIHLRVHIHDFVSIVQVSSFLNTLCQKKDVEQTLFNCVRTVGMQEEIQENVHPHVRSQSDAPTITELVDL